MYGCSLVRVYKEDCDPSPPSFLPLFPPYLLPFLPSLLQSFFFNPLFSVSFYFYFLFLFLFLQPLFLFLLHPFYSLRFSSSSLSPFPSLPRHLSASSHSLTPSFLSSSPLLPPSLSFPVTSLSLLIPSLLPSYTPFLSCLLSIPLLFPSYLS